MSFRADPFLVVQGSPMSYCTVEEIGSAAQGRSNVALAADLRIVRNTESQINAYLEFDGLYDLEDTWEVIGYAGALTNIDGSSNLFLGFPVIDLSRVKVYSASGALIEDYDSIGVTDHYSRFWTTSDDRTFADGISLSVTGVRGHAERIDQDTSDELVAGQTVLRSGAKVLIEEDENALADDMLLSPPPELTHVAITIARRLLTLERDQNATYARDNRLGVLTSLIDVLDRYR